MNTGDTAGDIVGNIILIFWMASVTALTYFIGKRFDLADKRLDAIERRLAMDEEDSNTEEAAC